MLNALDAVVQLAGIKCISLGNPDEGFVNHFAHDDCYDDFFLHVTLEYSGTITQALQLNTWADYNGQQFVGRSCVFCGQSIAPPDETPKSEAA